MASPAPLRMPRELRIIGQELTKQIRMSRNGNPRVITWFNLNSGKTHYYILKKSQEYEVYASFWSWQELMAWAKRYRFDTVDITELTYKSRTVSLEDLKRDG